MMRDLRSALRLSGAGAIVLAVLASPIVGSVSLSCAAQAEDVAGPPSPPEDAPVLRPGERVLRPFGAIEISTFTRTEKDQETVFRIEFLIRNESVSNTTFIIEKSLRIVADGVPRAPDGYTTCCGVQVAADSAEYGWATFSARGRPRVVYLLIGARDEGRSYLRWQ